MGLLPRAVVKVALALVLALAAIGCDAKLPEPESPGAQLLHDRCRDCHRLYAPSSMTIGMWDTQMEKMRRLYVEKNIRWFTPTEERTVHDYLARFAGQE